ncbi:MAG: hypothetical protein R3343_05640 [Nitriliruptorales bacterium]|nr:hypothetical protein [Nitriliruptorales bacterium]
MTLRIVTLFFIVVGVAACGVAQDDLADLADVEPTGPTATATAGETGADLALTERCTESELGYRIAYPDGWRTNPGDVLPACRLFDPESVDITAGTEIPFDIAVTIRSSDEPLETFTSEDEGAEVLGSERTTVAGHDAVALEKRGTGAALVPEGQRFYQYAVDLGPTTLVATTHEVGRDLNDAVTLLDQMMATLELVDHDSDRDRNDTGSSEHDHSEEPSEEPSPEDTETTAATLPSEQRRCTIEPDVESVEEIRFAHPAGWRVESDTCTYFDPVADEVADDTEPDVAVTMRTADVTFEEAAASGPETRDEVRYVGATSGHTTVRIRAVATGEGQRPEGTPTLTYVVDLGRDSGTGTLIATASSSPGASFELASRALDRIARTLIVSPPTPAAETMVITRRERDPAPYVVTYDHECFRLHRDDLRQPAADEACDLTLGEKQFAAATLSDGDLEVVTGLTTPLAAFVVSDAASAPYGAVTQSLEGASAFAYEIIDTPIEIRALDVDGQQRATTTVG